MLQDLYEKHKPIRNRIRNLEPISLIFRAIDKLAIWDNHPVERCYLPWELLLLIKWVFLYSEPGYKLKAVSEIDLNRCINDIRNLYSDIKLPSQKHEAQTEILDKFVRRIAFQQFPYQTRIYEVKDVVARQLILFVDFGEEYEISKRFESITCIPVNEFILLSFATWTLLNISKNLNLTVMNFSSYAKPADTEHFLRMLSLDLNSGKKFIKEDIESKKKSFEVQLYELTPLVICPFFHNGNTFVRYSKKLFDITFSNYVYDLLKEHDTDFARDFGDIFQKYIEEGLRYLNCEYLTENQMKELLPKGSKKVDFILPYRDCTVLVEVKSAEMHRVARVLQTTESLTRNLDDSIIKAVLQIYEVAHHLRSSNIPGRIYNTDRFCGIVITYQDYYLGANPDVWKEFIGKCVEPELTKEGIPFDLIPCENLFYVSAKEFDYLIGGLKKVNELSLPQILEKVKQNNSNVHTQKLMFVQHLEEIFGMQYYRPDYLDGRFEEMCREAKNRLKV